VTAILIFTRTTDYRHESIPHGTQVLTDIAVAEGWTAEHTEDPRTFTAERLAAFDVVVWLSTSGDVLDDAGRRDFAAWLAAGGAYAGIHCAMFTEPSWPEYERICGAYFAGHPEIQPATVCVADADHPSTAHLPSSWTHVDEWYECRTPPVGRTILLTVDESTYVGGTMGPDHPIAWYGPYGAGATWYTALGHDPEAFDDPLIREHLRGGLLSLVGPRA
jgi:type 1 glutamine amidotransferase